MENSIKMSNLSSGEIGYLWTTYQLETLGKCSLKAFIQHVEDEQTKVVLEELETFSAGVVEQIEHFLENENYPIPHGFTDKDVNLSAPRLFSDMLYLEILLQSIKVALPIYQLAYIEMTKPAIQEFYHKATQDLMDLEKKVKKLTIDKGIYVPSPRIPTPLQVDMVKKENFIAGWVGDKRPLLAMEIANLVFNAKRNGVGHAVITGFSQVAQSKEVRRYFERGRDISLKQLEVFTEILHNDHLPTSSMIWTSEVTDSTVPHYTDKMMMQMITSLIASGMKSYGTAMSMSARRDLGVHYTRLLAEVALYANDGAEISIKNGWMEQPPMAANRKNLAK